jgi:hypothetical protein
MDEILQQRPGEIRLVRVDEVVVPEERMRQLGDFERIVESIRTVGLISPILVRRDTLQLVCGLHRLEAVRALGHEEILARIIDLPDLLVELVEVHENLARIDLTALERAEHVLQAKQLYEAVYPQVRQGGLPGRAGGGKEAAKGARVASFVDDTAKKTGLSPRTLQEDAQIARLVPAVRAAVRGTPLENRKRDLVALSRLPLEKHLPVVRMVLTGRAATVPEAARKLGLKPPQPRRAPRLPKAEEVREIYDPTYAHAGLDELERKYPKFSRSPEDAEVDRALKRTGLAFNVLAAALGALARFPYQFIEERSEIMKAVIRILKHQLPGVDRFFQQTLIRAVTDTPINRTPILAEAVEELVDPEEGWDDEEYNEYVAEQSNLPY